MEVFRGIPLLVQLIWWYFAAPVAIRAFGKWINFAPLADYQSNAFVLAVVGLVICYGAYMSEIFRAGIQSIPKGQIEAARSQGMTYMQAMRYVILPQAIRVVLPPVGNEFIMLIKDTSLVSAVAMADLTRRGREYHVYPFQSHRDLDHGGLALSGNDPFFHRVFWSIWKNGKVTRGNA